MNATLQPPFFVLTPTHAVSDDAAGIADLLERSAPVTIPVPEDDVRRRIADFLVIRDHREQVIASVAMPERAGAIELRSLAVDSRWRGHGLGAILVKQVIETADARGEDVSCVSIDPDFFLRFGFDELKGSRPPRSESRGLTIAGRRRVALRRRPRQGAVHGAEA